MYEDRVYKKKLLKANRENPFHNKDYRPAPVVEASALIVEYANKDEEINALWLKPLDTVSCNVVLDYHGNGKRIANNIRQIISNSFPNVHVSLFSTRTERGRSISNESRCVYRKKDNGKKEEEPVED